MTQRLLLEGAPPRAGAYAHAVVSDGLVYVSGQGPKDPRTGRLPESFDAQVQQALDNLAFILDGANSAMTEVIKLNAYLADLTNFDSFNAIFEKNFGGTLPARTTIGCQLHGIMFEVDCVAKVRA
ncbi:RidA family protein [Shinella pollutisoli]|uniref:RidA family protein n=1 Tax=Shinella pollutisoli TaxID=2250594 RepID=A0ABV7DEM0_9HYPH|nr:RidA family protein [Shinella pollutisoli]